MHYQLHTLILLNIGSILDLPSSEWFGDFPPRVHVHVIDSGRPQNLSSLFGGSEGSERVIVWDDGGAERLDDERKAWETLNVSILWSNQLLRALIVFLLKNEPEPDSDASSDDDSSEDMPEDPEEEDVQSPSRKRRSLSDGSRTPSKRKRKRLDNDVRAAALFSIYKFLWWFQRPSRASREQRDEYYALLDKYYMSGTWCGQSAAGIVYILATALERVDNDLLWYAQNYSLHSFAILTNQRLAILGLINQYTRCRISRTEYEKFHSIYYDEVSRLNPLPPTNDVHGLAALSADDMSLRTTDELRFELFRHWTLYDAMSHSSYVAGKLGLWKEQGRKRLAGLLAKMG